MGTVNDWPRFWNRAEPRPPPMPADLVGGGFSSCPVGWTPAAWTSDSGRQKARGRLRLPEAPSRELHLLAGARRSALLVRPIRPLRANPTPLMPGGGASSTAVGSGGRAPGSRRRDRPRVPRFFAVGSFHRVRRARLDEAYTDRSDRVSPRRWPQTPRALGLGEPNTNVAISGTPCRSAVAACELLTSPVAACAPCGAPAPLRQDPSLRRLV